MKRLAFVLTIAIVCTTGSYRSLAQNYFAGTVKFTVKYEGDINPQKHRPHEETVLIYENKTKEFDWTWGDAYQMIYDGDSLTRTNIINVTGYGSFGYIYESEAIDYVMLSRTYTYEERADTKNILGYECKGYNITVVMLEGNDDGWGSEEENEDEEGEEILKTVKYVVYTTKEIGKDSNINAFTFPGLSGYPLYVEKIDGDVKEIRQAKEVKKGKVKIYDFMIPSGCKMCKDQRTWWKEYRSLVKHFERLQKERE
jgi:hypothetical protein